MKNNLIIKSFISLILLFVLAFLNIQNIFGYLLNFLFLLALLFCTIKKKDSPFIFIMLVFSMSSISLFMSETNELLLVIYYIWTITVVYSYFKYVFNLNNNKFNLVFKNIKMPDDKLYLAVKYLSGPIKKFNKNALVVRENEAFLISIEDDNGEVFKIHLKFSDIINLTTKEKPYFKTKNSLTNYEVDFAKSYFSGRTIRDFDIIRTSRIIKSYEIIIKTKKEQIKLLSFNNPEIFNI